MSSAHLHPEFGYFCASASLRRVLWAAFFFALLGLIAVTGGIRPMASHDQTADDQSITARLEQTAALERLVPSDEQPRIEVRPQSAPGAAARKTDGPKPEGGKTCEDTTWAYLDGKCLSGKTRKPRMVRVPVNRPAIALIPLGRSGSASADIAAPTSVAASAPDRAKSDPAPLKPPQSAPGDAVSAQASDAALQAFAASKKPQRTAQNRTQRRNKSGNENPWWRENRADHWGWRGRPGYADARVSGREGYSGWSW